MSVIFRNFLVLLRKTSCIKGLLLKEEYVERYYYRYSGAIIIKLLEIRFEVSIYVWPATKMLFDWIGVVSFICRPSHFFEIQMPRYKQKWKG